MKNTILHKRKSTCLFAMGFIFRRQVKETYYVCNSYRRVFLLSSNTAVMVLYKHVPTCITDQYLARYSTVASIHVHIKCTDIHYIMPAQCRQLMFSLLLSLSPAVKFSEIQKYFFPSYFIIRHRDVGRASDHGIDDYTTATNTCDDKHKLLLYNIVK